MDEPDSDANALRSIDEEGLDFEGRARLASVRQAMFGVSTEPTRIGRFVLVEALGAGGMGIVYSAHDPRLERRIALKLVKPELVGTLKDEARLLREAQAMARLSHPNVVQIHDVGVADGRLFIAMELVPGGTLAAWLATSERPWRAIVGRFIEAGRGLAAAHAVGIVHRDFKPENVLYGVDGRVRVTDFGLARGAAATSEGSERNNGPKDTLSGAGQASLTTSGAIAGTPYYMAPELFMGRPATPASDQFSFCVALYHALNGVRPFAGDDRGALMRAVITGKREEPPRLRIPRRIHQALVRGLSVAPEQRFASMAALLAAIGPRSPGRRVAMVAGSVVGGVALLGGVAALLGAGGPYACAATETRFGAGNTETAYRVPAGCTAIRVRAWGGGGGGAVHPGGGGGYVEAVLRVVPEAELTVAVGGGGGHWGNGALADLTGGAHGGPGGFSGASSGGYSGVREGSWWLLVAGGGGGAGIWGWGGGGGGSQGERGGPESGLRGGGGTPLDGGAGGFSLHGAVPGAEGKGMQGGLGGASPEIVTGDDSKGVGGGGGGGGLFAGGGGGGDAWGFGKDGRSGGGGGGSGHVEPARSIGAPVLISATRQESPLADASGGAGHGGDGRMADGTEATSGRPGLVLISTEPDPAGA